MEKNNMLRIAPAILELIRPMTHIQGHEQQTSYMDGITVKISEQYKPPPRINLPISYAQRLSLNKHLEDNMPSYNFDVENRVKEQLVAMKRIKNEAAENRKLRTERIKEEMKVREERKKEEAAKEKKVSESVEKTIETSQESSRGCGVSSNNGILQPVQVKSCGGILTPVPLKNNGGSVVNSNRADFSSFNISDFEADTSSPFDNMELKTLNDMEELAQVLRSENHTTTPAYTTYSSVQTFPSPYSYSTVDYNGYLNADHPSGITHHKNFYGPFNYAQTALEPQTSVDECENNYGLRPTAAVSNILRALETKLNLSDEHCGSSSNLGNSTPENRNSLSTLKKNAKCYEDPFNTLPNNLQELTIALSTMGFPRTRVARACQLFGDNRAKIVEYLIGMTELLTNGYEEEHASRILQDRFDYLGRVLPLPSNPEV